MVAWGQKLTGQRNKKNFWDDKTVFYSKVLGLWNEYICQNHLRAHLKFMIPWYVHLPQFFKTYLSLGEKAKSGNAIPWFKVSNIFPSWGQSMNPYTFWFPTTSNNLPNAHSAVHCHFHSLLNVCLLLSHPKIFTLFYFSP